jgi:hypothetical protein
MARSLGPRSRITPRWFDCCSTGVSVRARRGAYLPWRATSSMRCLVGAGRLTWTSDGHPIYRPGPFGPVVEETPLTIAARVGAARIVRLMLRRGASDSEGVALLESVMRGDAEIAKALLDAGVALRSREIAMARERLDHTGAAAAGHKAVLAMLRQRGYKPGYKGTRGSALAVVLGIPGAQPVYPLRLWSRLPRGGLLRAADGARPRPRHAHALRRSLTARPPSRRAPKPTSLR